MKSSMSARLHNSKLLTLSDVRNRLVPANLIARFDTHRALDSALKFARVAGPREFRPTCGLNGPLPLDSVVAPSI